MLGFTVPLFVLLGIEALLALLLLGPRSFASPALLLCKATRSSVRLSTRQRIPYVGVQTACGQNLC
jgi:hypothetical protein